MKNPRWKTATTVLLRGFFFLLFAHAMHAQPYQNSVSISSGYLTEAQIFLYPQSPYPIERQKTADLGAAACFSVSYRYKLYSPISFQIRGEYIQSNAGETDQVGTDIHHGYNVWLLEADATFSLPFSGERFEMFVGGGAGVYLGQREYRIASIEAESVASTPAFGIHLVVGAEYLFTEHLGLRVDVLFRDPQISVENRFRQSSVTSHGVEYPLQDTPFLSHINLNGNVYAIGISWHF